MENKIPTAEEFLKNFNRQEGHTFEQSVPEAMIEFTKLHVEAALEAAAKSAMFSHESVKGKIHYDVYPLTNIK